MAEVDVARDQQRAPQLGNRIVGRELRTLVEPFRYQQFGTGADKFSLAFDLDLGAHEQLRRRDDDDGTEVERPGEAHRAFEEGNVAHGEAKGHISSHCLSMISAQTRSAFVATENRFPPIVS